MTSTSGDFDRRVSAVSALADPLRRRVYELVVRSPDPLGHDAVAVRAVRVDGARRRALRLPVRAAKPDGPAGTGDVG